MAITALITAATLVAAPLAAAKRALLSCSWEDIRQEAEVLRAQAEMHAAATNTWPVEGNGNFQHFIPEARCLSIALAFVWFSRDFSLCGRDKV